ncbi:hypothetical protein VTN00DRAFT_150 [Thermoascus crustaceus]|uniref:uncharacterized protein n=1 Tax=Thermoascus crustaceus TaxID=5088 RepID=UPI003742A816
MRNRGFLITRRGYEARLRLGVVRKRATRRNAKSLRAARNHSVDGAWKVQGEARSLYRDSSRARRAFLANATARGTDHSGHRPARARAGAVAANLAALAARTADGVHASPRSSLDSARSLDTSSAPPSPPLRRVVGVLRRVTRRAWHLAAGNSQSAARPRQKYRVAQRSSPLASGLVNLTREVPPSTRAVPVCGKGTSLVHPSVLASEHGRPPTAHTGQSDHTTHHLCFPPYARRSPTIPSLPSGPYSELALIAAPARCLA